MVRTITFTSCTFKVGMYTYFYFLYIQGWYVHILLLLVHSRLVCTHTFTSCTFKVGLYTYFYSCIFKVGMYTYFHFLYIQGWYEHILLLHVHARLVCTHTFTSCIFKVGLFTFQGWYEDILLFYVHSRLV